MMMTMLLLPMMLMIPLKASPAVPKLFLTEADVRHVEGRRRVDVDPMTQPSAESVATPNHQEEE